MKPIDSLSPGRPLSPVRRLEGAPQAQSATVGENTAKSAASLTAAATEAPVDTARVNEIRVALRENRYPITPTRIADALIAAKYMLVEGN